jgi:hypothetical protein
MIDRRTILGALLAAATSYPAGSRSNKALDQEALQAALFAFSIGEMARVAAASPARNRFSHRRTLSDHTNRGVTMPNNDTLYSSCWLDLPTGVHADLDIPLNSGRYVSLAIMGMDTDVLALASSNGQSTATGKYRIVGPGWRKKAPDDRLLIRIPSADAWALVRIGVSDKQDLAAAQAVQSKIVSNIETSRSLQRITAPLVQDRPKRLLEQVNAVLERTTPRSPLAMRARRHRQFGLGKMTQVSPAANTAWRKAVFALDAAAIGDITEFGEIINGWHWPDKAIAQYGKNERFRAAVALSGLGALPEMEAVYLTAMTDIKGAPLSSSRQYRIDFATPPPVDAFWSLSAYRAEPDGRYFFIDNPLNRYAVGSSNQELRNGGVVIASTSKPSEYSSVWLPIADGPFRLVLRAYRPTLTLRSKRWAPPNIVPIS